MNMGILPWTCAVCFLLGILIVDVCEETVNSCAEILPKMYEVLNTAVLNVRGILMLLKILL